MYEGHLRGYFLALRADMRGKRGRGFRRPKSFSGRDDGGLICLRLWGYFILSASAAFVSSALLAITSATCTFTQREAFSSNSNKTDVRERVKSLAHQQRVLNTIGEQQQLPTQATPTLFPLHARQVNKTKCTECKCPHHLFRV